MLVQRGNIYFFYKTARLEKGIIATFRVQLLRTLKTLFFPNANPVISST